MKKRTMGIEIEYPLIFSPLPELERHYEFQSINAQDQLNKLSEWLIGEVAQTKINHLKTSRPTFWLVNGGGLYRDAIDNAYHPEYYTPECTNIYDLICHTKAGDLFLEILRRRLQKKLEKIGINGRLNLYRTNTIFNIDKNEEIEVTLGCHENYLLEKKIDFINLEKNLTPFFVSRIILSGAGLIHYSRNRGTEYLISQRAPFIKSTISGATTENRAIINTREKTLADSKKYRRFHVIIGDSNISELSIFLAIGTTHLALRLIEEGWNAPQELTLENPIKTLNDIALNLDLKKRVALKNGNELTAIEIQKIYLKAAIERLLEISPEEIKIIKEWERTLKNLEKNPSSMDQELDWLIKLKLIKNYSKKNSLAENNPKIKELEAKYHSLNPEENIYRILLKRGLVKRMTTDNDIIRAVRMPPLEKTRANARSLLIKKMKNSKFELASQFTWSGGSIIKPWRNEPSIHIVMNDPFESSLSEIVLRIFNNK